MYIKKNLKILSGFIKVIFRTAKYIIHMFLVIIMPI